jgi:hypothetical protein
VLLLQSATSPVVQSISASASGTTPGPVNVGDGTATLKRPAPWSTIAGVNGLKIPSMINVTDGPPEPTGTAPDNAAAPTSAPPTHNVSRDSSTSPGSSSLTSIWRNESPPKLKRSVAGATKLISASVWT